MSERRRRCLAAGSVGLALALVACGGDGDDTSQTDGEAGGSLAGQEVVVVLYGGAIDALNESIHPAFEEETGISATAVSGMDPAKMYQMVKQDAVEWDVVLLGPEETPITDQWLEPLDYSVITNTEGIPETAIHDYGITSDFYTMVIAYRTDVYGDNPPQSWADFWNTEEFPGPRSLPRRAYDIVELALLADGVPSEEMYPLDVERALDKIREIQPDVPKFWTGGNEPMELLLAGEVDMAAVWVSRVVATVEEDENAPIGFTMNEHLAAQDILAIPKGAPHAEAAQEYINYRLRPEVQAEILNITGTIAPSTALADEFIDPDRQQYNPASEENAPLGHFRDPEYWIDDHADIDAQVAEILGI